jgi:Ca2+-binding EF-hand superfamily protein
MSDVNENELAGGTRAQNLSLPIELSAEKIQDFQAAFSIMDTQSKGFVGADDINQVAQTAGSLKKWIDIENNFCSFMKI